MEYPNRPHALISRNAGSLLLVKRWESLTFLVHHSSALRRSKNFQMLYMFFCSEKDRVSAMAIIPSSNEPSNLLRVCKILDYLK